VRVFLDRMAASVDRIFARLPGSMRTIARQFTQVGLVGLIGLVIDVGVFNLLRWLVPELGPIWPKVISTALAIIANRRREVVREGAEFVLVSALGALIPLACLWVSHYVLGFTSQLADNISANVIGLVLGTLFRFTFYRLWVFHPERGTRPADDRELTPAAARPSSPGETPDRLAAPRPDR